MPGAEGSMLFVNPPWNLRAGNVWRHVAGATPPLGLASLAAAIEREGVASEILDAQAMGIDEREAVDAIAARRPAWVGFTATTPIVKGAIRIAEAARERLPEARIVFGGPHATALPGDVLASSAVDYVLAGETETTLARLLRGDAEETVPGLWRRGPDGSSIGNAAAPLVDDLDTLADPAFGKLPIGKYRPSLGNYRLLPCLGITVSRGCYGRCAFCFRDIFGSRVRVHSTARILGMMARLKAEHGIREVQFYDDIFMGSKSRIREFCEAALKDNIKMMWVCNLRAELTDDETARLMRRAGCHTVDYGVESGNPEALKEMRKDVALEKTLEAMRTARRAGLRIKNGFILGYSGETKESMARTARFAVTADADTAMFNIATPFPGTDLFRECEANGTLLSRDWDLYDYATPLIRLPDASPEELMDIYRMAYRRFYLRPRVFARWMSRMTSVEQLRMAASALMGILALVFAEKRRAEK